MITKATISYNYNNNSQDCVTGDIIKSTNSEMIIHTDNLVNAIRFDKSRMIGQMLESSSNIKNISIIDYDLWKYTNEIHFLLPNKFTHKEDEVIISGVFNSKTTINKDKITIETDDVMFKLTYNSKQNIWTVDSEYIVESVNYDHKMYNTNSSGSEIFRIGTNYSINSLGVNSERI